MRYSKRDAAKEQIVTAIRLFFTSGSSSCAVHTLTAAALMVLQDIHRSQGQTYLLDIEQHIRPEKLKEWRALVRGQANFLKHADRDPNGALKLNEEQTQLQLLEAVNAFATLYGKKTYSMMVYQLWFSCAHPGFFDGGGWLTLKADLEKMGFKTSRFTKQDAAVMLDLQQPDLELDNSS